MNEIVAVIHLFEPYSTRPYFPDRRKAVNTTQLIERRMEAG